MVTEISVHNLRVNPAQMRTRVGVLERMERIIEDLCSVEDGFVLLDEGLYTFLQEQVPETLSVPYRLWDGSKEDEILLLIQANSGAEEPDLVGQALAYRAAIDTGISHERLAQVTGRPVRWLEALVFLLTLPAIFGELINDGLLDLSIVRASDSHRRTFGQRLLEEEPLLSDRQIWTLAQWLLMEWQRVQTGSSHQMAPDSDGSLVEVHVTYFGLVMPGGVMEEVWDDD